MKATPVSEIPTTLKEVIKLNRRVDRYFKPDFQKSHDVKYLKVDPENQLFITMEKKTRRSKPMFYIRSYDMAGRVTFAKDGNGITKYEKALDDFRLISLAREKGRKRDEPKPNLQLVPNTLIGNAEQMEPRKVEVRRPNEAHLGLYGVCLSSVLQSHLKNADLMTYNPVRVIDLAFELYEKSKAKLGL